MNFFMVVPDFCLKLREECNELRPPMAHQSRTESEKERGRESLCISRSTLQLLTYKCMHPHHYHGSGLLGHTYWETRHLGITLTCKGLMVQGS